MFNFPSDCISETTRSSTLEIGSIIKNWAIIVHVSALPFLNKETIRAAFHGKGATPHCEQIVISHF